MPALYQCTHRSNSGIQCTKEQVDGSDLFCVLHETNPDAFDLVRYREGKRKALQYDLTKLASERAIGTMKELLDDEDTPAAVKLKLVTEMLDRTGVRGGTEVDVSVTHTTAPATLLAKRLADIADRNAPAVISGSVISDDDEDAAYPTPPALPASIPSERTA